MDTEKCKALLMVLEKGNLSEAAATLGYTPSGMSRMMSAMEKESGVGLLVRTNQGVQATVECENLLPTIRELAKLGEVYERKCEEISGLFVGTVRVGSAYSKYLSVLAEAIHAFTKDYPGVKIESQEQFSSVLLERLGRRELDICIVSHREGDFDWTPLFDDDMLVWVPEDYEPLDEKIYPIKRFEEDAFIDIFPGNQSDNALIFEKYGIVPNNKYSALTTFSAHALVEAGIGVTLTNGVDGKDWGGRVRTLTPEPRITLPIGIATQRKEEMTPAAKRFLTYVDAALGKKVNLS